MKNWLTRYGLETILVASVGLLIAQVAPSAWDTLANWPLPGVQVVQAWDKPHPGLASHYLLRLPANGAPRAAGSPPIVLVLHGAGQRGAEREKLQNLRLAEMLAAAGPAPAVVVSPMCLPKTGWNSESLLAAVEEVRAKHHLDPGPIAILGYSMGAYGAWRLAAHAPETVAAIAPYAGGGDPSTAERLAGVRIWAIHGTKDDVVPVTQSREMVEAVNAAGGAARLDEIPDGNHRLQLLSPWLPKVLPWLLKPATLTGQDPPGASP